MQRSVVITGAFGSLGRAAVARFAALGDRVTAMDLAAPPPETQHCDLALGGVDLTDPVAVGAAFDRIADAHGGVDVLVNIAGGFAMGRVDSDDDLWDRMYRLNARTTLTATRAALPHLKQSAAGRIVNIGALGALQSGAALSAYAASKEAVHKLTESLAAELADTAITVNAVLPSTIDTPANREAMPKANTSKWVTPEAISDVISFLASHDARALNGILLPVTKGNS